MTISPTKFPSVTSSQLAVVIRMEMKIGLSSMSEVGHQYFIYVLFFFQDCMVYLIRINFRADLFSRTLNFDNFRADLFSRTPT